MPVWSCYFPTENAFHCSHDQARTTIRLPQPSRSCPHLPLQTAIISFLLLEQRLSEGRGYRPRAGLRLDRHHWVFSSPLCLSPSLLAESTVPSTVPGTWKGFNYSVGKNKCQKLGLDFSLLGKAWCLSTSGGMAVPSLRKSLRRY